MKLVKEVRLSLPAFLLLALFSIVMAGENCYLASVNVRQQHTIRQYMGLEQGVDATPRPKALVPLGSRKHQSCSLTNSCTPCTGKW